MAQTLANGVVIPEGSDFIDSAGVGAMRNMGTSVDAALDKTLSTEALSAVDLNTMKSPGTYRMAAPYPTGYTNVPTGNTTASMLLVVSGPSPATWAAQEIYQYGSNPKRWWRISRTQTLWNDWVEVGAGGGGPSDIPVNALAVGGRDMRMRLFKDQYPLVSTGDKGAVVFRYDHGLTNFKNVLLPLHEQYGIVPYVAMNSRNWDLPENSGATQAEAKTWDVEWGNHTSDHNDKTGIHDVWDTIVNGRIELEEQVGKTVHGFTVPGLPASGGPSYDKLDGFGVGYASGYSNSYAGNLILNHHAICSGVQGAIFRPLDGVIRIGMRHTGWENKAWANIKADIDQAIATKTVVTLMQHPRTMNMSGYWTPALADQVLAYVRSKIDSGELANISYMQSHHAQLAPLDAGGGGTPSEPAIYRSGLRDITGELRDGWTGSLFVEREGDNVYYRGTLNGSAATSDDPWLIPSGLRCTALQSGGGSHDYGAGLAYTGGNPPTVYRINHYFNRFRIENSAGQTSNLSINQTYRTTDAIPSTLPGVPV